jgi:hypothetical protein
MNLCSASVDEADRRRLESITIQPVMKYDGCVSGNVEDSICVIFSNFSYVQV